VEGAGAFKAGAQVVGEKGAVAGDHGGEHDGIVWREAERGGQMAHGRGQGEQAGGRGMLQGGESAGQEGGWRGRI